jgi:hypothetical protein
MKDERSKSRTYDIGKRQPGFEARRSGYANIRALVDQPNNDFGTGKELGTQKSSFT